jgi:hypothetical protein
MSGQQSGPKCGICGQPGHNRRTHTNAVAPQDLLGVLAAEVARFRPESDRDVVRDALTDVAGHASEHGEGVDRIPGESGYAAGTRPPGVYVAPDPALADPGMSYMSASELAWAADETAHDEAIQRVSDLLAGTLAGEVAEDNYPGEFGSVDVHGNVRPLIIRAPGVYELDAAEYLADPVLGGSISNSGGRLIIDPGCPAKYRHAQDSGASKTSDAFDLGHAVHTVALGKGETIEVRPGEFRDYRTKAAREWLASVRARGNTPVTPEQMVQVQAMAEALLADPWAAQLLGQPGKPEQVLVWWDETSGVWRRAMLDWLPDAPVPGRRLVIVDLKSCEAAAPNEDMSRKIYNFAYHRQAVTQMDGAIALGLAPDGAETVLLFIETSAPYLVTPVRIDTRAQAIGRYENRAALDAFAQCQASGVWPGYVPEGDPIPILALPAYIEKRFDGVH